MKTNIYIGGEKNIDTILFNPPLKSTNEASFEIISDVILGEFHSGVVLLYELLSRISDPSIDIHQLYEDDDNELNNIQTFSQWEVKDVKSNGNYEIVLKNDSKIKNIMGNNNEKTINLIISSNDPFICILNNRSMKVNYSINNAEIAKYDSFDENWFIIRTIMAYNTEKNEHDVTSLIKDIKNNDKLCKQTIVLLPVDNLRICNYDIEQGLSWEKLAFQTYNSILCSEYLRMMGFVVITFGHEGCLVVHKNDDGSHNCELIYYPFKIEGDITQAAKNSGFANLLTLQTIIAKFLSEINNGSLDVMELLCKGIKYGLKAMRKLVITGYNISKNDTDAKWVVNYPFDDITKIINENSEECCESQESISSIVFDFANTQIRNKSISIREIMIPNDSLKTILENIVRKGFSKINEDMGIPLLMYGKLKSIDRTEIEHLRNVYHIIDNYMNKSNIKEPISLCVFGTPGSGKSTSIREIITCMQKNNVNFLEFNLSQMNDVKELHNAFHTIRDIGIQGNMPVVFWDEFDVSKTNDKFLWFKHFLAPIQDGKFFDGHAFRYIGRSIFVFAGGVFSSMDEFQNIKTNCNIGDPELKELKIPDFQSRIKGFIDVIGLNPDDCNIKCNKGMHCSRRSYLFRRAILLRDFLEKKLELNQNDIIPIAQNILYAFLFAKEYKYGSRSLKTIIDMCNIKPRSPFTISCLQEISALKLYVSEDFIDILNDTYDDNIQYIKKSKLKMPCITNSHAYVPISGT